MWPVWLHIEKTLACSGVFVTAGIRAPVTKGDDLCSQPLLHFGTTNQQLAGHITLPFVRSFGSTAAGSHRSHSELHSDG